MKYELTNESKTIKGHRVYRIRALEQIHGRVEPGQIGGWIESEWNLSQSGRCWISEEAVVFGDAIVHADAHIHGNAIICDHADIYGNAEVYDCAVISGIARVYDCARVYNNALVTGTARVGNAARICMDADVRSMRHYCMISPVPVIGLTATFFRNKRNGISVELRCLNGDLDKLPDAAGEKYHHKIDKEVLSIVQVVKTLIDCSVD